MTTSTERTAVETQVRAFLLGEPHGKDDLLAEDFVEEYPQSGERIRGRANVLAMLAVNPAPPRVTGGARLVWCGDQILLAEARASYPDGPWWVVILYELSGGRLSHETAYFGAPFPAPEWRRPYVVAMPAEEPETDPGGHELVERETVERYLAALAVNDFAALKQLRHAQFVSDMPQSGERYPSHDAQTAAERAYPGGLPAVTKAQLRGAPDTWAVGPAFSVSRLSGRGAHWAAEALLTYPSGERSHSVGVLEFRSGLVVRERQYYMAPFEAAAWRAPWVDRD
jgi:hypothetical protein